MPDQEIVTNLNKAFLAPTAIKSWLFSLEQRSQSLRCCQFSKQESLDILKDEPPDTFAGRLYLGAKLAAPDVEDFVKSILKS